mmetsp:Transcript_22739/g.40507  ORF Transcript_22739/g.40507 Transcript_22739/m.40507 type:complete len:312 (-) Transcript_22739:38-973(-)
MGTALRLATVVSSTSPVRPPSRRPTLSVLAAGPATNMGNDSAKLEKVPANRLFTSEPDPRMFGNGKNPSPRPANWTNDNWLKSRFHFSFAEYRDPHNQSFGALRVMNDDLVQPARGFGTHGHANAEICTYIVHGELTHQDSMGTSETLQRGAIQFMSAGTGVRHSEFNKNPDKPLRFIQMWITPAKQGLPPNYGSAVGNASDRKNKWSHMVSDVRDKKSTTPVEIYQDINMYVTELDAGVSLPLKIGAGRQAYMLCVEGEAVDVSCGESREQLCAHDAAKLFCSRQAASELNVEAANDSGAHVLVVEMNAS